MVAVEGARIKASVRRTIVDREAVKRRGRNVSGGETVQSDSRKEKIRGKSNNNNEMSGGSPRFPDAEFSLVLSKKNTNSRYDVALHFSCRFHFQSERIEEEKKERKRI